MGLMSSLIYGVADIILQVTTNLVTTTWGPCLCCKDMSGSILGTLTSKSEFPECIGY